MERQLKKNEIKQETEDEYSSQTSSDLLSQSITVNSKKNDSEHPRIKKMDPEKSTLNRRQHTTKNLTSPLKEKKQVDYHARKTDINVTSRESAKITQVGDFFSLDKSIDTNQKRNNSDQSKSSTS